MRICVVLIWLQLAVTACFGSINYNLKLGSNGRGLRLAKGNRKLSKLTLHGGENDDLHASLQSNLPTPTTIIADEGSCDYPHVLAVDSIVEKFNSNRTTGLVDHEVQNRLNLYGENKLQKKPPKTMMKLFVEQFDDKLVQMLLGTVVLSSIFASFEANKKALMEPIAILAVLIINALIGVYQQQSALSSLETLKRLQAQSCTVLRDGVWRSDISVDNLVPGDMINLRVGDCIPADARIIEIYSSVLGTDEANLTGESNIVYKSTHVLAKDSSLAERVNMLYSGTTVIKSSCLAMVTATGSVTELGKINKCIEQVDEMDAKTPLAMQLDEFGGKLSKIIAGICIASWLMNIRHFSSKSFPSKLHGGIHYAKAAIALGVAAIPEGLPAIITLVLSLGTLKMAKRNVIVRKLPSVETLGCTSVICTDKTGTLTTNQMTVASFTTFNQSEEGGGAITLQEHTVEGNSYQFHHKIHHLDVNNTNMAYDALMFVGTLCNDAKIDTTASAGSRPIGEPTEIALKVFVEKLGINLGESMNELDRQHSTTSDYYHSLYHRLALLEFDRDRKSMSVLVENRETADRYLAVKGAAELIVSRCNRIKLADGSILPLTAELREEILSNISKQANSALRCIALAYKPQEDLHSDLLGEEPVLAADKFIDYEQEMILIGVCGIHDPPRLEVASAIQKCRDAGIRIMMMTGDSKETATAIARAVQIFGPYEDISSHVFNTKDFFTYPRDEQLAMLSTGNKVFCRSEPKDKQLLITMLHELNEITAMTGDGVNDAPALKQADIGIAMGITGTEVAKNAADMILVDDNFQSIVAAIEEGRNIYQNMQSFISFLISANFGEVILILLSTILNFPSPLSPLHLLWINLVTDGPTAIALGFNPPDRQIMRLPPRKKNESMFTKMAYVRFLITGLYVGSASLASFVEYMYQQYNIPVSTLMKWSSLSNVFTKLQHRKAQSMVLTVIVCMELMKSLSAVSLNQSILTVSPFQNKWLILAVISSLLMHVGAMYTPMLNKLLGIVPISYKDWKTIASYVIPILIVEEVMKIFSRLFLKRTKKTTAAVRDNITATEAVTGVEPSSAATYPPF